ncbi:hypothetical protein OCA08_03335 [Bacillus cereus]|nr:hypothetical protein [Bacillus cereus]
MALLFLGEPDQNGIAVVLSTVYKKELLDEETAKKGIEVNEKDIPTLVNPIGKVAVLKYNITKKEFVIVYVDRPLQSDEVVKNLQQENGQLGRQVSDLEIQLIEKSKEAAVLAQQVGNVEVKQIQSNKDVKELGKALTDLEIQFLLLQEGGKK